MKISIGIPTCNRTDLLIEALASCIKQTFKPAEIIIGDDSTDQHSKKLIESLNLINKTGIKIKYFHNEPPLGQGRNVNKIIDQIEGDNFLLLHDDDLIAPEALETLASAVKKSDEEYVVYGNQYVIKESGDICLQSTNRLNNVIFHTQEQITHPLSPINAAIVQQFPNNAFLIKTASLKKTQYFVPEREAIVQNAVDFDFGLRLALNGVKFIFINVYTAKYRTTRKSISTESNNKAALMAYHLIETLPSNVGDVQYKTYRLTYLAPVAVMQAIKDMQFRIAAKIYFSKFHRVKIFTCGGINRATRFFLYYFRGLLNAGNQKFKPFITINRNGTDYDRINV